MANVCKMEFYFNRAEIESLLAANPKAKGIIISHEIVQEKPRGSMNLLNLAYIKARVDPMPKKKAAAKSTVKSAKLMKGPGDPGTPGDPDEVPGCPYPPGCNLG